MAQPLISRASYLHIYLDVFREIGIPVERRLSNSKLPSLIEEQPDAYVSLPLALDWIARTSSDLTPMEMGFFASRAVTLDSCDASLQTAVLDAATGRARVERFFRLAGVEDNSVIPRYHREGDHVRLIIGNSPLDGHPNACLAQWMNIQLVIAIIQSIAGKAWLPAEITFVSSLAVPEVAQEAFRTTRILTGQQSTSVLVQAEIFARSCYDMTTSETVQSGETFDIDAMDVWTFSRTLRSLIKPYLGDEGFDLGATAELAGMSARSLQRRLKHCGTSYGELVQETRFHIARSMLLDTSAMVRDVAMLSGYENPQHFSRAFRRMTGMSPSEYRKKC
jgi:AraC-like DNA-binding protein